MATADVNGIYSRLNEGTQYTPMNASTYADWSLEAGDVVTVSKGGKNYRTPVMTGRVKWNGAGRVDIESTGNKKREPLSKQSKNQYSEGTRGGGGYYGAKQGGEDHAWLEDTDDHVALVAKNLVGYTKDGTELWSEIAKFEVGKDGINSSVKQTLAGLDLAWTEIRQTKNNISLIVDGAGVVTPASLILAVNGNKSSAKLSADQIEINGNTTLRGLLNVDGGNLIVSKNIYTGLGGGYVQTTSVRLVGASSAQGAVVVNLNANSLANAVTHAELKDSGKTLYLKLFNGTEINFSKAVKLAGAWDGSRKYTVNATQTNAGKTVKVATLYTTLYQKLDSIDWSGGYNAGVGMLRALIVDTSGKTATTNAGLITVDASGAYSAGQATRPTVATNTSERPTGATDLRAELYIGPATKTVTIRIGSNLWYCKVST